MSRKQCRFKGTTKECFCCKKFKSFACFYSSKINKSGLFTNCIECEKQRTRKRMPEKLAGNKLYYRTLHGHLTKIYNAMKRRCNPSNAVSRPWYYGVKVKLTKEDFFRWSLKQTNFMELHLVWEQSGYTRNLVPSIDRIDSDLHYSVDNMRWLSLAEHMKITNAKRWGKIDACA